MPRKQKAVVLTAMLLTSLAASSFSAPAGASAAESVSAGKAIAAANGIVPDSDTDAAALSVLYDLNGGKLPVMEFENGGNVSHINGRISDRTVRNAGAAKAVIASVDSLLGIQDADAVLEFTDSNADEYATNYTFRQLYHGIPVEGASVTVFSDAQTQKADYLNSSLVTGLSMNTTPAVSADRVRDIVREVYQTGLRTEPELLIIRTQDGSRNLAYMATAYSLEVGAVYLSAEDGSILRGPAAPDSADLTPEHNVAGHSGVYSKWTEDYENPITGLKTFEIVKEGPIRITNTYDYIFRLHDTTRDIWMYKNDIDNHSLEDLIVDKFNIRYNKGKADDDPTKVLPNPTIQNHRLFLSSVEDDKYGIKASDIKKYCYTQEKDKIDEDMDIAEGVLYQVERVYDYYSHSLNWVGTTNRRNSSKDSKVTSNPSYSKADRLLVKPCCTEEDGFGPGAAGSDRVFNIIRFGDTPSGFVLNHAATEIAVVGHEYTHRIMDNVLQWTQDDLCYDRDNKKYYGETACLNEAYADIMGQYAERSILGKANWKSGDVIRKDGGCSRDMTKESYYKSTSLVPFLDTTTSPSKWDCIDADSMHYVRKDEVKNTKNLEAHEGSTIISHIAYKMDQAGISPEIAQKIWFDSIQKLKSQISADSPECGFLKCRTAVADAAMDVVETEEINALKEASGNTKLTKDGLTEKQLKKIEKKQKQELIRVYSAFNYAQIFPASYYKNGDFNQKREINVGDITRDRKIDSADVSLVTRYARNQNVLSDAEQISLGDVDYDGRITMADAEIIQRYIVCGTEIN